ncbi:MAG: zf-TFIIB domain-containing protein [Saprospiraceae bacterium]|nr:zf-TFIIB domain-containing protein [Pyrinomonadaceae bacterium]
MFLGTEFCGHCGAKSVKAEIFTDENVGKCPRCNIDLHAVKINATQIRECTRCGGFWSGIEKFEDLCASKEQQSAVLSFIGKRIEEVRPSPVSYVPCPDCRELMNRSNFAKTSGVIIDLCKKHGVWFDAEELPKIIDFINSGGMARAREKERVAIEEERKALRDEQRRQNVQDQRSGINNSWETDVESPLTKFVNLFFG